MVLRIGCMIEQDQGFAIDYPVSKHAYPNHLEEQPASQVQIDLTYLIYHSPSSLMMAITSLAIEVITSVAKGCTSTALHMCVLCSVYVCICAGRQAD